jgi:hypothetical protein
MTELGCCEVCWRVEGVRVPAVAWEDVATGECVDGPGADALGLCGPCAAPDEAVKTCRCCGAGHTLSAWRALPLLGVWEGLEMRNCPCGSTLGLPVGSGE